MKYTELLELCKALQVRNELLTEAAVLIVRGVRSGNWKTARDDVAALTEALAAPVDPEQSLLAKYLALQEVCDDLQKRLDGLKAYGVTLRDLIESFEGMQLQNEESVPDGAHFVAMTDVYIRDAVLPQLRLVQKELQNVQ